MVLNLMNKADENPDYKRIYAYIVKEFRKTKYFWHGVWDETFYSLRVYEVSKELIKQLKKKVHTQAVLVASLLHDIGKVKITKEFLDRDWPKHAEIGARITKKYLKKLGHSKEFIDEVCYLVKNHDKRKMEDKLIELQILQDADYLADSGLVGFFRPMQKFVGKKQSVIEKIKYRLNKKNSRLNMKNLNLEISKKITKKHDRIEKKFFKELGKLIDSELLSS
jgi:putative nucleotidyltransferase with HDIG domain